MLIRHVMIKVDDQDRAVSFYTSIGGFEKARLPQGSRSIGRPYTRGRELRALN